MFGLFDGFASSPRVEIDLGADGLLYAGPEDAGVKRIEFDASVPITADEPRISGVLLFSSASK